MSQTAQSHPAAPRFAAAFAERSDAYLEFDADEAYALDPAALDALKLAHARRLFAKQRPLIDMIGRLADREGIAEIGAFDDLVPLLLGHESYRSYPQTWLEGGDFTRMTKWLSKLVSKDLISIDVSAAKTIEEWFAILAREAGMNVVICGAEGKATFLPRTYAERRAFYKAMYWSYNDAIRTVIGDDAALRPGVDRVPLVHPGARTGSRPSPLFLHLSPPLFCAGVVVTPLRPNHT